MALHELITNAVKYGALSVPAGRVDLRWSVTPDEGGDRLVLDWLESGGPAVAKPTRRGFGSLLLERVLSPELNGEVDGGLSAGRRAGTDRGPAGRARAALIRSTHIHQPRRPPMPTSVKQLMDAANAAVPKISGKEAQEMVAKGALLLDIRDSAELAATGKAAGALHMPRGSLEFKADPESPGHDKNFAKDAR